MTNAECAFVSMWNQQCERVTGYFMQQKWLIPHGQQYESPCPCRNHGVVDVLVKESSACGIANNTYQPAREEWITVPALAPQATDAQQRHTDIQQLQK